MTGTREYLSVKRQHYLTASVIDTSDLLLKPGYSPAHFDYLDLPRPNAESLQGRSEGAPHNGKRGCSPDVVVGSSLLCSSHASLNAACTSLRRTALRDQTVST